MTRRASLLRGLAALAAFAGAWLWLRRDAPDARRAGEAPGNAAVASAAPPGLAAGWSRRSATAAEAASAADPPPGDATPLRGTVLDAQRRPLPGARVHRVGDAPDAPALDTDADGAFGLPGPPERTSVWIHAPGLVMPSDDLGWLRRKEAREFQLVEGVRIRVRVTRADGGGPVVGALVRSFAGDAAGSAPRLRPSDEHVTDADGRAEVLVPPGRGCVLAETRGFAPGRSSVVEVGSQGAEVTVELAIGTTLEGRVLAESGALLADAKLHCVVGDLYDRRAVTAEDGTFRFDGLPVGVAGGGLSIRAAGFGPRAVNLPPIVPGGGQAFELTLSAAHALDVLCLGRDGSPAVDAYVQARPTDGAWHLVERDEPAPVRGRTGPDGHVTLEPVGVGDWHVEAGGRNLRIDDPVTITVLAGAPLVPLVLKEIRRRGLTFEVRVLDPEGTPLLGARVEELIEFASPRQPPSFTAVDDPFEVDAAGVATLPLFTDTPTKISVLAPGYARITRLLGRLTPDGPRIDVRLPDGKAMLRFVDRAGAPMVVGLALEGRRARVDTPSQRRSRPWATSEGQETDAMGRVTFRGLEDGEYHLRLANGNHSIVAGPATVRAGATEVTWTLVGVDETKRPNRSTILLRDALTGAAIRDASLVVVETDDWCVERDPGAAAFDAPELPPGPYELAIFAPGCLPTRAPRVLLNATDGPVTLRLTLDRGASVAGIVRDEEGHAVPGVEVGVIGDEGASATTDDTGAYTLSGLAAGLRAILVTSPRMTKAVEKFVRVDRAFEAQVDVVVALAGAVAVQCEGAPWGNGVRLVLRDANDSVVSTASMEYFLSPGSGPSGSRGPSDVHTFESLAPAEYSLLVTWNGEPEPPIPLRVRLGETTRVTITPP